MNGQIRGQPGGDGGFGLIDRELWIQSQVDAVDPTQAPQKPLGGRDVHQGKGPVQGPGRPLVQKQSAHRQGFPPIPDVEVEAGIRVQAVAAGQLLCQQDGAGVAEQLQKLAGAGGLRLAGEPHQPVVAKTLVPENVDPQNS